MLTILAAAADTGVAGVTGGFQGSARTPTENATASVPAIAARYTNVASARCGCTMFLHCSSTNTAVAHHSSAAHGEATIAYCA
jgi:hypothetical protein